MSRPEWNEVNEGRVLITFRINVMFAQSSSALLSRFLVLTFILPRRRTSTKLPGSSCVDTKVHQGALSVCTDCRNHAGARKRAYLRPHPRRFFVFIFLDFQFDVLVSRHLTQRGERDCTTFGAFYNVAS